MKRISGKKLRKKRMQKNNYDDTFCLLSDSQTKIEFEKGENINNYLEGMYEIY